MVVWKGSSLSHTAVNVEILRAQLKAGLTFFLSKFFFEVLNVLFVCLYVEYHISRCKIGASEDIVFTCSDRAASQTSLRNLNWSRWRLQISLSSSCLLQLVWSTALCRTMTDGSLNPVKLPQTGSVLQDKHATQRCPGSVNENTAYIVVVVVAEGTETNQQK